MNEMDENQPKKPRKPTGLKGGGARLWNTITTEYELETNELSVLAEVCLTKTRIEQLDKIVDAEGLIIDSPQGKKMNPAAVEGRQLRLLLNQLARTLKFPGLELDK